MSLCVTCCLLLFYSLCLLSLRAFYMHNAGSMAGLPPCVKEKSRDRSSKTHRSLPQVRKSNHHQLNPLCSMRLNVSRPRFPGRGGFTPVRTCAAAAASCPYISNQSHSEKNVDHDTRSAPYSLLTLHAFLSRRQLLLLLRLLLLTSL